MSGSINIDSKGYGKIYKAVMRNRQLLLLAKAIYAYFCTYAGSGYKAYPRREKIVRDLSINKDTYTKHLNTLVAEGYIAKERTATGNIYTIMQMVPSYDKVVATADAELTDMLVMDNVKAKGFGTVPKLMMLDRRLTAQAKAIYAYFASFAGAGTTAFPRRSTIARELKISEKSYYPHFKLLLDTGYISVESTRKNGKYDVSIYHLSDNITFPPNPTSHTMSEKGHDGDNREIIAINRSGASLDTAMSEKRPYCGEMLKTQESTEAMSEKAPSDKGMSDKSTQESFGHTNINNNPTTNNSYKKEQVYNHQGCAPDDNQPVPLVSLEQAKIVMRYDHLRCQALAWGELKETLGHFSDCQDKLRYVCKATEILDEIAYQVKERLNNTEDPQLITDAISSDAFEHLFDEALARWDTISFYKGVCKSSDEEFVCWICVI